MSKIPYIYSGFRRPEEAEAFAKSINDKGGKAEVVTRTALATLENEIIVVSLEDDEGTGTNE